MIPRHSKTPGADRFPALVSDMPARNLEAARAPRFPGGESTAPTALSGNGLSAPHPLPGGAGTDGVPRESARGRAAAEAGATHPAVRGPVPGRPVPGTAAPFPAPLSMGDGAASGTASGVRVGSAPEAGTKPDAIARWRQALADKAKSQRRQRGRHRKQSGYRPGMTRREPPGGAA